MFFITAKLALNFVEKLICKKSKCLQLCYLTLQKTNKNIERDMKSHSRTFLQILLILAIHPINCLAQKDSVNSIKAKESFNIDSLSQDCSTTKWTNTQKEKSPYKLKPLQLIMPGALIAVGVIGLESDWLKYQNREIRDELQENIDKKITIDDFTQYAPLVATYGLNLCGLRGKHGYGDLTIISGTACILMGIAVNVAKSTTRVERPDGSSRNSFPSGHTATAFMGAEILRKEYWDVSPWIGITGYAVAIGTGFFRMYNNRHWLTDVIAGAGTGILCAEAAYWFYPLIAKGIFKKRFLKNTYLSPVITNQSKGIVCAISF